MVEVKLLGAPSTELEGAEYTSSGSTSTRSTASRLPTELLLLEVFARLPLPSVYLLRLLSKSWHASLSSAPFLAAWSRYAAASGQPWLVMGDVRYDAPHRMPSDPDLLAFCPHTCSWIPLPIHSPGPRILPRPLYPYSMSYDLLADSAGGLVCAIARYDNAQPNRSASRRRRHRHRRRPRRNIAAGAAAQVLPPNMQYWSYMGCRFTFVVFNPLTGQTRALPAPPSPLQLAAQGHLLDFELDPLGLVLTMLASPASSHYNVILCKTLDGIHRYSGGMLIFSSQTNLWSCITSSSSSSSGVTTSHGDAGISILQADLFEWDESECHILGYFVSSHTWCKLPGPSSLQPLPATASPALITIHKGRLLFARPICSGSLATGFSIWEFQRADLQRRSSHISTSATGNSWVLLAETPVHLQEPIGGSENEEGEAPADYEIIRSGSLVCLVISNFGDEIRDYAEDDDFLSSLTYDLDHHSWLRLPPMDDELGLLFTGGFSFQPSFIATV